MAARPCAAETLNESEFPFVKKSLYPLQRAGNANPKLPDMDAGLSEWSAQSIF